MRNSTFLFGTTVMSTPDKTYENQDCSAIGYYCLFILKLTFLCFNLKCEVY